jgi:phosphatidylglycerophosphatase C
VSEADDPKEHIAVFDFDGTLTKVDTLRLLFLSVTSLRALIWAVFMSPILMLAALRGGPARDRAKEALTRRLLGGMSDQVLRLASDRLVDRIMESELRKDTLACLAWHKDRGHEVVVISASFEPYVKAVAEKLGASAVFSTKWEVGEDGLLTGRLDGPNVRGPEKARILREYTRLRSCLIYAYGNSRGDLEMLEMADVSRWVPAVESFQWCPACESSPLE